MSKNILALDPASYVTGWAIFTLNDKNEAKLIKYGSFKIPKGMKLSQRMCLIREKINLLIEKSKPAHLITERPFMGPNAHTFMVLSMGFGVISGLSNEKNIPIIAMPPMEAKIHLVGNNKMKGEKSKMIIKEKLELFYKVVFENTDESDAVATGVTGIDKYLSKNVTEKEY